MGGCQNYGPFLDPCYNTAPNIQGTQKRTITLTTTHIGISRGISRHVKADKRLSTNTWSVRGA